MPTIRNFQVEFKEIVKEIISPIFKNLNFKKKENNFNHRINDLVQVFNIQKSSWNDKDNVSFTFNLGFFNNTIYKVAWDKQSIPDNVKEYDCFLSTRLGMLSHKKDYWYELKEDNNFDDIKNNIKNDITVFAKPLFEQFTSLETLTERFIREPSNEPLEYVAGLYYRIVFFMENNKVDLGAQLIKESYIDSLIPKTNTTKIIYPDGREEIVDSKRELNQHYIDSIKRLAKYYNINL